MANHYPPLPPSAYGPSYNNAAYPIPALYQNGPPAQHGHQPSNGYPPQNYPSSAHGAVNASRFSANAQIPNAGGHFPPYPHAPFTPDHFRQFSSANLPPPPPPPSFPSVPLPNFGYPPFPMQPSMPNHTVQQNFPTNTTTGGSNPYHPFVVNNMPPYVSQALSHMATRTKIIGGVGGSGEVEDNAAKSVSIDGLSRTVSQDGDARVPLSSQHPSEAEPSYGTPAMPAMTVDTNAPARPNEIPNLMRANSGVSDGAYSGSSYNPPSASTPDLHEANPVDMVSSTEEHHDRVTNFHNEGKSYSELRESAKGALLSLLPYNIKYPELAAENLDAQLLRRLYEEMGINVDTVPVSVITPDPRNLDTRLVTPSVSASARDAGAPETLINGSSGSAAIVRAEEKNSSQPSVKPAAPVSRPAVSTIDVPRATENTSRSPTSTPALLSAAKPGVERKDMIAALLAMKKVHPSRSTATTTSPVPVPLPVSKVLTPTPESVSGTPPITQALPEHTADLTATSNSSALPQPAAKLKSKIQTELVRQRMEKLRKESAAKQLAQTQAPREQAGIQSAAFPEGEGATGAVPMGIDLEDGADLDTRERTQFNPKENSAPPESTTDDRMRLAFESLIPGLFMTEDEEPTFSRDGQLHFEPSHANEDTTGNTNVLEVRRATTQAATIAGSEQSHLPAMQLVGRQPAPIHLPQKRALAVDLFEESTGPPSKRPPVQWKSSEDEVVEHNHDDSGSVSEGEIVEQGPAEEVVSRANENDGAVDIAKAGPILAPTSSPYDETHPLSGAGTGSSLFPMPTWSAPAISTPIRPAGAEDMARKEMEIESMRKRIAAMEEKRKAKQRQTQSPRPGSPDLPSSMLATTDRTPRSPVVASQSPTQAALADSHDTFSEQSFRESPVPSAASQAPIVSAPVDNSAVARAEALKQKILARKALLSAQSRSSVPPGKAVIKPTDRQAKAAELRKELARRAAEAEEARRREQEMLEELQRLEEQADPEQNNGDALLEASSMSDGAAVDEGQPHGSILSTVVTSAEVTKPESTQQVDQADRTFQTGQDEESRVDVPGTFEASQVTPSDLGTLNETNLKGGGVVGGAPGTMNDDVLDSESDSRQPETDSTRSIPPPAKAEHYPAGAIDEHHRVEHVQDIQNESGMEIDDESDGSASMSGSDSEDYEPTELLDHPVPISGTAEDESDEYDPEEVSMPIPEGDAYEGLHGFKFGARMDEQLVQHLEVPSRSEQVPDEALAADTDINGPHHGLPRTEANSLTNPHEIPPPVADSVPMDKAADVLPTPVDRFVPYQSPLTMLKSFRYQPEFTDSVSSGYRSLTYSNNIDANVPLCHTEAMGDVCNDPGCDEQHFGQMSLADEKILVQMSSANDLKDKDQKDRFLTGLKQVIADLRSRGVKEFSMVARELAAYRRRFRDEQDSAFATPSV